VTSPTASSRSPRRPSWAGRDYSLLTAAAVTGLGSHGALVAAAFAVLGTGGDGGDVGLGAAARTLPLVLFPLIGGALADRLPRHRVMVAANVLNCLSQAAFAALVPAGAPDHAGGPWRRRARVNRCRTPRRGARVTARRPRPAPARHPR
jgi:MFS family permease